MFLLRKVPTARLICGVMYNSDKVLQEAMDVLTKKYGPIKSTGPLFPLSYTKYYNDEMGDSIMRTYYTFEKIIRHDQLANIKCFTNKLEKRLSTNGKRNINLDPGYCELSRIVLASAKDFSHRIYIGKGIFAEVTLLYMNGTYNTLGWTYPDYKDENTIRYFNQVRQEYYNEIKAKEI